MDGSTRGGGHSEALRNYTLGRTLGIGTFGKVKIAEHKLTGHRVAIKIINCRHMENMGMEEKVKREIKILKLFIHPHIIRLYEVICTPTDMYLVMEYCKYGELFDYIVEKGRLQEDEARRIFQQIISGVEYCHRNMVVLCDLKPENLLLDSKYNVKLADFGLSNIMHDGHSKTSCGSTNYAAPEVISGELYAGPEVDVWSCGVILYALLCGTLPFDDENVPNLYNKIKGGLYTLPSHLSALARDLIPRMLEVEPMKRITIREIREHQWFQIRLPRYLAVPPPDTTQQAKMIDEDTLRDVVNMGFNKEHVCESLCSRLQNEATVAYYLLLDNRFRATSCYLGADYQESTDRNLNQLASSESTISATRKNCESAMETAEYEKIEAPGVGQANEIENDVEVELKEEVEREAVDAVPVEESTFHNEATRSTDLVDSDSINHSSLISELESCDDVHTEGRSREISMTTVEQFKCEASWENGTMVADGAEITSETENGSQEKPCDVVVDQGEPVDLNVDALVVDDAQVGSVTGYESPVYDTVGVISKKDESNEIIGGSTPQEHQSKICNASTMSDECSTRTGNVVPLLVNEVDETCNNTCRENVNLSTKSSDEAETKCLEAIEPSSIGMVVLVERKDYGEHAPGELRDDHAEFTGPQRVYMIKIPRFAGDDLWIKTQAAQARLDQLTQERDAINRRKQKQKVICDQYGEKLEAARREEREARAAHGDKKNDLNSLRSMIGKMNQANSIEAIDELIATKERTMQHETISLKAEKLLIEEINDLKAQRKQLSSTIGSKAEINEAFDQKDHIHEQHKALKKDYDVLFTNLKSLEENTRKILKSFEDEKIGLRKLNEEYRAANELRQKAYSEWSELKAEPFKKNQYFFTYRENRNTAESLKMSGDMYKLRSYCKDQIERVMEMWNGDEDFRKLYVESNKISTLRRLGTLDGRKLGPDEDPPIFPSRRPMNTSPLTASSPDVPILTSVPAPVFASPASVPDKEDSFPVLPSPQISKRAKSKAFGSSTQNENNDVSTTEAEDNKQNEKDRARLMEEQPGLARDAEELARKEEELRKQRAAAEKEQLRVEQKAKAKEAEERKRRKVEKEKERAEFKARKEAEEKEKKKAKKDKRKGPTPADSSAIGDSNTSDYPREVEVAQSTAPKRLSRPAAAIKQLNRVQPMPAPLRNRGKRKMLQYILIAVAMLSVLALFMAGNYIPRLKALHF